MSLGFISNKITHYVAASKLAVSSGWSGIRRHVA